MKHFYTNFKCQTNFVCTPFSKFDLVFAASSLFHEHLNHNNFLFSETSWKTIWKTRNCYAEVVLETFSRQVSKTSIRFGDRQLFAGLTVFGLNLCKIARSAKETVYAPRFQSWGLFLQCHHFYTTRCYFCV